MQCVVFSQRVEIVESYSERRDCADQRIAEFIDACGYVPIPLPNNTAIVENIMEIIKPVGIILTGGNSLLEYGGNAPERDAVDKKLIELGIRNDIPIYGFCRGMQSILDYFGNSLVNVNGHVAQKHKVYESGKFIEVNSYHNQGCVNLEKKSNITILAQATDGVIEAIRHNDHRIIGTMWHPEREAVYCEKDIIRFRELVEKRGEK